MDLGLILLGIILLLSFLMWIGISRYLRNIKLSAKRNPIFTSQYKFGIITGIISGVIVIIADRGFNAILEGWRSANILTQNNTLNLIASAFSLIVYTIFGVTLILFLIFYIINKGLIGSK
jgi:hypothetical protein